MRLNSSFWIKSCIVLLLTGVLGSDALAYRMVGTEADFIERAGFAGDAKVVALGMDVHADSIRSTFSIQEEKLVYFMVFRNGKYLRNIKFTAEWYKPDGGRYHAQEFGQAWGNWNIAMVELPIAGTEVVKHVGKWRLKVFEENGELMADRAFMISSS